MGNLDKTIMKRVGPMLIIFCLLLAKICHGQETEEHLKISDFKFISIFGMTTKEPKSTYSLLGSGYFRAPHSDNSDSLIIEWIKRHPNALVVPISSHGPVFRGDKDSKMIYCWILDNKDTLNNYLIKNGCFPGGTMLRVKTWNEMKNREKKLFKHIDEKPEGKVYIDIKTYNNFIKQINVAELYAKNKKLGIWHNDNKGFNK
jgi:hypothetical protein